MSGDLEMIRALQRESADNTSATLALSPNVSLIWVKRSTLPGPKTKLAPSWNGFSPKFVLAVAGGIGTFARNGVGATHQVKQVRALQVGSAVCDAFHIDQKRKRDASLFAE